MKPADVLRISTIQFAALLTVPAYSDGSDEAQHDISMLLARHQHDGADLVCGPRCVGFLLEYYGQDEVPELIELVRLLQWPDIESGSNLETLSSYLEEQGIFTLAMQLGPEQQLQWRSPVLLHLKPTAEHSVGHFIVWLPSSHDAEAHVWAGLRGLTEIPVSELYEATSGVVLLTSHTPIEDPDAAVQNTSSDISRWARLVPPVVVLCSILLFGFLFGFRHHPLTKTTT